MRRVVITGLGTVNPLGHGVREYWDALAAGKNAVAPVTLFDASSYPTTVGAEVKDYDGSWAFQDKKMVSRLDRYQIMGHAAAKQALDDCGVDVSKVAERFGVIMGTGIGAMATITKEQRTLDARGHKRVTPFLIPAIIPNMLSGYFSIEYGLKGPNLSVVTACATANHAIGEALEIIRRNEADLMVAGGAEAAIAELTYAGFCNMKAMSTRNDATSSRPFDKGRDGFVMGEGAAVVILEEYEHAKARGARIYAEVAGFGQSADAHHLTAPHPEGEGGYRAMRMALEKAGMTPDQIQLVNAHGTSTPLGDKGETGAIKKCFGDHASKLMVHSTKSMVGHLLGAAGSVELIAGLMAIQEGVVHPTLNQFESDPDCDLDYVPNTARKAKVDAFLSNSFGFGGHNATLVVRRAGA
ncbi:MAG TPA: beta-ketoacyl-ACP synthase II [Fibrobacteria bacterium]|nr:beta-ketoacyl-ACP synthase II [Fibrobacteria bacterium]HOX52157.1 beta-ketoacyl-ACP synthase II [Fibrobacteria bacterium]